MAFDLKLIESFVTVAETLSFSVAAARMNTVQSAVSAHIKSLEQQMNRPLVQRGRGQPVSITREGAAFLIQARRLLLLADEMQHSQPEAEGRDPLRLGTSVTFALSIVPRALSTLTFGGNVPAVTVRTARSHELINLLEQGLIDIALVFDQGPHPMRKATVETDLAWVAKKSFVQPTNAPLPLAFLDDARDLRRHAYKAMDDYNTIITSLSTHPDPIGLRAVIEAGLAVTVLPKQTIGGSLEDVGDRLKLPKLRQVPISIYAREVLGNAELNEITNSLVSSLSSE